MTRSFSLGRVRQPDNDLIEQRKKEQALDGLSNEELQRIFFDEMNSD